MRFDEIGGLPFANWTRRHVGEMIDILVDGRIVIRLKILTPITGGSLALTGFMAAEIEKLVPRLLDGRSRLSVRSDERI